MSDVFDKFPTPDLMRALDGLGVAMWVTSSDAEGRYPGWPQLDAKDNMARLRTYGMKKAVCARPNQRWAFVDVDTKNGASIADVEAWLASLGVTPWAKITTPSGGAHFYVNGSPEPVNYPSENKALWKVLNLPGTEVYAGSHFSFVPGTERRKYPGKGYSVEWMRLDLVDADSSPLWEALEQAKQQARHEGRYSGNPANVKTNPVSMPDAGSSMRGVAFTQQVVESEAAKLAATSSGGRNTQLHESAMKIASGTLLTESETISALMPACEANGLVHDDGVSACLATIKSGYAHGSAARRDTPATNPDTFPDTPSLHIVDKSTSLAPRQTPPDKPLQEPPSEPGSEDQPYRRLVLTPASQIHAKPVEWVWSPDGDNRMPAGALVTAAGREGTGKSSFGVWLAAQITNGTLEGCWQGKKRGVIYLAIEDSWEHTIVPRLMVAGADLDRVYRADVLTQDGDEVTLTLPVDNELLLAETIRNDVGLIVADPLMSLMSGRIDTHKESSTRLALDPLAKLADASGAVVLGIAHFNKSSSTDISSLITGSGAFKNVPRAIFGFASSKSGESVMTQSKNSLGRYDLPSINYSINSQQLVIDGKDSEFGLFNFNGISDKSVGDILNEGNSDNNDEDASDCASWLREWASEEGGTLKASEVYPAAVKAGYSKMQADRAKVKLGMVSKRQGFGKGSVSFWVIPDTESRETSLHVVSHTSRHTSHTSRVSERRELREVCEKYGDSDDEAKHHREHIGSIGSTSQKRAPYALYGAPYVNSEGIFTTLDLAKYGGQPTKTDPTQDQLS